MRTLITITAALALVTAAPAIDAGAVSSSQAVRPTCTYTPLLPKRVSFDRDTIKRRIALGIKGPAECRTGQIAVTTKIKRRANQQTGYFLSWNGPGRSPITFSPAYGIGRFRLYSRACTVYSGDKSVSCRVAQRVSVMKYRAKASLHASRSGSRVRFVVHVSRYVYQVGFRAERTTATIQRRAGKKWVDIHAARTTKHGYTFAYRHVAPATYRVVAAPTRIAFGAVSTTVQK